MKLSLRLLAVFSIVASLSSVIAFASNGPKAEGQLEYCPTCSAQAGHAVFKPKGEENLGGESSPNRGQSAIMDSDSANAAR